MQSEKSMLYHYNFCKITFLNYVNLDNVSSYINAEIEYAIIKEEFIVKEKAYLFKMK